MDINVPVYKMFGYAPNITTAQCSDAVSSQHLVGIEVELEGFKKGPHDDLKYWKLEHDGSLRDNGIEFILRVPLTGVDLEAAAMEMEREVQESGALGNHRCSTHIHLDVRNFTIQQIRLLSMVYAMYEKFLFKYVGGNREDNFYCVPVYRSLDNRQKIVHALSTGRFRHAPKYSAFNIRPVNSLGSVEFRMQQAIMSAEKLIRWTRIIQCFAEFVERNPRTELSDVLGKYSADGPMDLFYEIFQADANELLSASDGMPEEDLRNCLLSAQDMIIMSREYGTTHRIMKRAMDVADKDQVTKIKNMHVLDVDYLKEIVGHAPQPEVGNIIEEFIQFVNQ